MSNVNSSKLMPSSPRIAIPVPHSGDRDYAERSLPQYEQAVRAAGGEPVRVELDQPASQVMSLVERCDGVLLPGSKADLNPQKYGASRHEKTEPADASRDAVDDLLLQDAYKLRKPVLGNCYGLQSLNVFKRGSLIQDIESKIDHSVGKTVAKAHMVEIEPESRLATLVGASAHQAIAVNSSHHQSADKVGNGLRVVARCAEDEIIEALEGTDPDHFVLAVQWHPERSVNEAPELAQSANAIFSAFIEAAKAKLAESDRIKSRGCEARAIPL